MVLYPHHFLFKTRSFRERVFYCARRCGFMTPGDSTACARRMARSLAGYGKRKMLRG